MPLVIATFEPVVLVVDNQASQLDYSLQSRYLTSASNLDRYSISEYCNTKDLPFLRRQGDLVRSCLLPHLARPLYEYGEFFQARYIILRMHRQGNPKNG